MDNRVEGLRIEVASRFDSLEARLPMLEKLRELEARIAELERKVSVQA